MKELPDTLTIDGEVYVRQTSAKEPEVKPFPQEGDTYYTYDDVGYGINSTWDGGGIDIARQSLGLIFETAEERDQDLAKRKANVAIRRWRDENCPFTEDWDDEDQKKYFGVYDHRGNSWHDGSAWSIENPATTYFATLDDLKRCQSAIPDAWDTLVGVNNEENE